MTDKRNYIKIFNRANNALCDFERLTLDIPIEHGAFEIFNKIENAQMELFQAYKMYQKYDIDGQFEIDEEL